MIQLAILVSIPAAVSTPAAPDACLFISGHCPHCPAMLALLADLLKQGRIGRLEAINVEAHPDAAASRGVRSVPWLELGGFELPGVRDRKEIEVWIDRAQATDDGLANYLHALLKEGRLDVARQRVSREPASLAGLLPIVANPEASLNVRAGAGVLFEEFAGQPAMQALVDDLGALTRHADARVRADACHYLHLTADAVARPYLEAALHDADPEVREIAEESLQALPS